MACIQRLALLIALSFQAAGCPALPAALCPPQPSIGWCSLSPCQFQTVPTAPFLQPLVVRPPASDSGDFAEYLADPCKGFPDADNMVPGEGPGGAGLCCAGARKLGLAGGCLP